MSPVKKGLPLPPASSVHPLGLAKLNSATGTSLTGSEIVVTTIHSQGIEYV